VRDLSLHILDLLENSVRAEADIIAVTIEEQPAENRLRITIEDNGPGLNVSAEQAMDPFYTTKSGKRTGLGLSLFQATAQMAGGTLTLSKSHLGGLAVDAVMQLDHIDRLPLGDLPASLFSLSLTNPHIDFWCRLIHGCNEDCIKLSELREKCAPAGQNPFILAKTFSESVKSSLRNFKILG
jgi:hypothetical protein